MSTAEPTRSALRVRRVAADDAAAHAAVVDVMKGGFFPGESACSAVGVSSHPSAEEQLLDLVRAVLQEGVSVAAYLGDTMVGAVVNKIQVRPPAGEMSFFERFAAERVSAPAAKFVMDFMIRVDSKADLFAEAGGEPLLELMFLGVLPEAGRRGVGAALCSEGIAVARHLGAKGVCAIFTSDYSRAIGRRLGFKELAVAEHSEFLVDGRPASELMAAHQQRSALVLLKLD